MSPGNTKSRFLPPFPSQRVARLLRPLVTSMPFMERAIEEAPPLCAAQLLSWRASSTLNILALPSMLAETIILVDAHSKPTTRLPWLKEQTRAPGSVSHTCSPPLRSPLATYLPSVLNRTAVNQSVCFFILCTISPVSVEKMRRKRSGPP